MISTSILLSVAIAATLIWGVVAVLSFVFDNQSAATRHQLWAWSTIAVMVTPVFANMLPVPRFQWTMSSSSNVVENGSPSFDSTSMQISLPDRLERPTDLENARNSQSELEQNTTPPKTTGGQAAIVDKATTNITTPRQFTIWNKIEFARLTCVWTGGVAVWLLFLLLGHIRCRRIVRRSLVVTEADALALLNQSRRDLQVTQQVTLVVAPDTKIPFVTGWLRPTIVLPSGYGNWHEETFEVVLLHELVHVQRRDLCWQALSRLCTGLAWFHPFSWLANWRLRVEREHACDDAVVRLGICPSNYASHLIEVASASRQNRISASVAMAVGPIENRVRALLNPKIDRIAATPRHGFWAVLTLAALVAIACVLSPATTTAQNGDPKPDKKIADRELLGAELTEPQIGQLVNQRNARNRKALKKIVSIDIPADRSLQDIVRQFVDQHRITVLLDQESFSRQGIRMIRWPAMKLNNVTLQSALSHVLDSASSKRAVTPVVEVRDGVIVLGIKLPWQRDPVATSIGSVIYQTVDQQSNAVAKCVVETPGIEGIFFTPVDDRGFCKVVGRGVYFHDTIARDRNALITSGPRELNVGPTSHGRMAFLNHVLHLVKPTTPFKLIMKPSMMAKVKVVGANPIRNVSVVIATRRELVQFTDSDGIAHFRVPRDMSWLGNVYAIRPRYGAVFGEFQRSENGIAELTLKMTGSRHVSVTVLNKLGSPVPNIAVAPIELIGSGEHGTMESNRWWKPPRGVAWELTDDQGQVKFNWTPSNATVRFAVMNREFSHSEVLMVPTKNPVLTLQRDVQVSGRITDSNQKPAAGVFVNAQGAGVNTRTAGVNTRTNADGVFKLKVPPDSWFYLEARDEDRRLQARKGWFNGAGSVQNVNIQLKPATRVFGQITDPEGKPIAGATLSCSYDGLPGRAPKVVEGATLSNGYGTIFHADERGRFEYFVAPGDYTIADIGYRTSKKIEVDEQAEIEVALALEKPSQPAEEKDVNEHNDMPIANSPEDAPSLNKTIRGLRERGEDEAAKFLETRLKYAMKIHLRRPKWPFIFGRVIVDKSDNPEYCDAQMQIHSTGWFLGSVGSRTKPVGFHMWGYRAATVVHGGEEGTIANVGDVRLEKFPTSQLASIKGEIVCAGETSPKDISVRVVLRSPRTNSGSGGTNGFRPWREKEDITLSDAFSFEHKGLNPMPHSISINAPGHIPFYKSFDLQRGEFDLGKLELELSPRFEIEFFKSDDLDFRQSTKQTANVYLGESFRTNKDADQSSWVKSGQLRFVQRDLPNDEGKMINLHCGLSGLKLTELGADAIESYQSAELKEDPVDQLRGYELQSGTVYLISHNYDSWSHKTLMRVTIVRQ